MQTVTNLTLKKIKDFVDPITTDRAPNDEVVYKRIVHQMKKLYKTLPYVRTIVNFHRHLPKWISQVKGTSPCRISWEVSWSHSCKTTQNLELYDH
jgi:hypothetical protein